MVERSEPSFIPGWLKGTGGGGSATQTFQDDSGFSRTKTSLVGNSSDFTWNSATSDKIFSPSTRRSALERPLPEKDHLGNQCSQYNLDRSSSARNHDIERNTPALRNTDQEYDLDHWSDKDRRKEWLLGMAAEEKDKDRDYGLLTTRLSLKLDSERKLRRSQSQSPRLSEQQGTRKLPEMVPSLPCVSESLSTSRHKAVFDRNFPTLGSDEKQNSFPPIPSNGSCSIASPRAMVGSPRPLWQGSARPDLNRASSPGLMGGFPITVAVSSSMNLSGIDVRSSLLAEVPNSRGIDARGSFLAEVPNSRGIDARSSVLAEVPNCRGSDGWSSLLAEGHISNGNIQAPTATVSVASAANSSQLATSVGGVPIGTIAPLNMAEALAQNPPRVRTPPQVSLESQRLEELALKQSRQLIPMTPSLPKTMILSDKSKAKASRTVDGTVMTSKGSQQPVSLQSNLSHKSTTARLEPPKQSQGKLLVLKSGKDGVVVPTLSRSDSGPPLIPQGSTASSTSAPSLATLNNGGVGLRKTILDVKGSVTAADDRRPSSLQARNRSDFFNSIRKKSSNAVASNLSNEIKSEISNESIDVSINKGENCTNNGSELKPNGIWEDSNLPSMSLTIYANGVSKHSPVVLDSPLQKGLSTEIQEETKVSFMPGASEEEEAAFMRSLGWEENAEGSELTEEEINAFYHELNQRKSPLNGTCKHKVMKTLSVSRFMGSLESISSACLSSSDSETDDEPPLSFANGIIV